MLPVSTDRVRLRRLEPRDAARLAGYRSDAAVARYQSWTDMTLDEARQFVAAQAAVPFGKPDGEWCQLSVADRSTDALLGDIGVCVRPPGDVAEIGFTLAPEAQGRGLATEACRAAIALIFETGSVETLEAIIDARNASAIAVVQRIGMSFSHAETVEFKGELCSEHHFVLARRNL